MVYHHLEVVCLHVPMGQFGWIRWIPCFWTKPCRRMCRQTPILGHLNMHCPQVDTRPACSPVVQNIKISVTFTKRFPNYFNKHGPTWGIMCQTLKTCLKTDERHWNTIYGGNENIHVPAILFWRVPWVQGFWPRGDLHCLLWVRLPVGRSGVPWLTLRAEAWGSRGWCYFWNGQI